MGKFRTALLGDIGGTNARFALVDLSSDKPVSSNIREYSSQSFKSGTDAVQTYLSEVNTKPDVAAIAVAGPVASGAVHFTNLGWSLSEQDLIGLGFARAQLLNDVEAQALATQHLEARDLHTVGDTQDGDPGATVAIIAPGTGFGASALVKSRGLSVSVAAEGGHATFAPADDVEHEIARELTRKFGHVSIERLLSGPGLKNLHEALNAIEGVGCDTETPTDITQRALDGDPLCARTLERFVAILGSVAGDFGLIYGARGGLFVGGGIAPRILSILDKGEFRRRFEAKGRFKTYLSSIPTRVILHSHAAFLGASDLALQLSRPS